MWTLNTMSAYLGVLTGGEGGQVWVFVPVQYVWTRSVALTTTRLQWRGGHRAEEQCRCAFRVHPQLCCRLRLEVHFLWQVAMAFLVCVCVPPWLWEFSGNCSCLYSHYIHAICHDFKAILFLVTVLQLRSVLLFLNVSLPIPCCWNGIVVIIFVSPSMW